jgi:hypothetical protein
MWLADVEAMMAAGKRKSRYPDVLMKPIQLQRPELGLWLHGDEIRHQTERVRSERFDLLKAHYGIGVEDPEHWQKLALCLISDHERGRLGVFLKSYGSEVKDPKYWQWLAICLACDHVPGLKVLPPKTGRPREWNIKLAQEFVRVTDDLKKNGRPLKQAVSEAAKKMGIHLTRAGTDKRVGTLENLYRQSKERIQPPRGTPLGCELDRVDDPRLKRLDEPQ